MSPTKGMTASPGDIEWQCPYCDTTEPTLREIQQHITNTTTGDHEGISGESPDEDIVAFDPESGDELDRYERTDVVRPQDAPLEDASKRKQAVYAWLANNRVEDADAFAAVTDADRDYAIQILGQIRRGEITRDYWEDLDRQLLAAMEDRLDDYTPDEGDTETMSTQQANEVEGTTDKEIIFNTHALMGDDINRKQVWQALQDAEIIDSGYEYFRRVYKNTVDGTADDNEIEAATSEQIQSVLESTLSQYGILADEEEAGEESAAADTAGGSASATALAQSASADGKSRLNTREGEVSAADVRKVREQIALLHEESQSLVDVDESVGARRAEFIGEKALSLLDGLLEEGSN